MNEAIQEQLISLRNLRQQDGEEFSHVIRQVYKDGSDISSLETLLYGLNDNIDDLSFLWVKADLERYIERFMSYSGSFVKIIFNNISVMLPHAQENLASIIAQILEDEDLYKALIEGVSSDDIRLSPEFIDIVSDLNPKQKKRIRALMKMT